jgi:LmbE family N-acetylglucosaminyl deacetylase
MKAVCIVAHPDDCLIFARPFILNNKYEWTIVYLTYKESNTRSLEVSAYWNKLGVATKFLGYDDKYEDSVNNAVTFNWTQTHKLIEDLTKDADLLLTHDVDGDYGHIHHKFVHSVVDNIDIPTVFFARTSRCNIEFECEPLNLSEFPVHKETIAMFPDIHIGRYWQ